MAPEPWDLSRMERRLKTWQESCSTCDFSCGILIAVPHRMSDYICFGSLSQRRRMSAPSPRLNGPRGSLILFLRALTSLKPETRTPWFSGRACRTGCVDRCRRVVPARGPMLRTVFLFAICALLHGQEFRATLSGEVTDPAGAAVAGAKITAIDVDRNTSVSETSNHLGRYVIPYLAPGNYKVTVDKTGFRTLVREGIRLSSGDHPDLDLKLEVGAVNETITVTGQSSQLQTENASRSALIENRALENIPTNGRNLYQLQYTLPGVSRPAPTGARWSSTRSATSTASPSAADARAKTRPFSTA